MKTNRFLSLLLALLAVAGCGWAQGGAPAPAAAVRLLGSIRSIGSSELVLGTDQGAEMAVKVQPGASIVRLEPGQTDLKSAAPMQFSGLQVGDRVLVRGKRDSDGVSLDAGLVIVMKQQDIAQRRREEILDWQRRSVGGLVKQIDIGTGTVTIAAGGKNMVVSTFPKTTYKRYAPDSVRWEDASDASFGQIHVGDQIRAKGVRNEDGTQMAADAILWGFRNISGLITSIDGVQGTLTVADLATKKPVTVKVTAESQIRKLPPQMAQRLAMFWKAGGRPGGAGALEPGRHAGGGPGASGQDAGSRPRDLNQVLGRLPAATLGDLRKGEAVMIVSTTGSAEQAPTAVTLLGGVEALLTASPEGTESLLTPWSLASAPSGE